MFLGSGPTCEAAGVAIPVGAASLTVILRRTGCTRLLLSRYPGVQRATGKWLG